MRNLLNFLKKYNNIIIFLLLEAFSVYLLTSRNEHQTSVFLGGVRTFAATIEKKTERMRGYFNLTGKNSLLAQENLLLKRELEQLRNDFQMSRSIDSSAINDYPYEWQLAMVINNSVNKQNNFITLNKGAIDGVEPDMAIVGPFGVVGIVVSVSDNVSVAMSLLNLDFRMSARLKKNSYYGSLTWDGNSHTSALFNEIPYHVEVVVGDTIETSGFSASFPAGMIVGFVSDIDESGGDFYKIKVDLSTDFRRLNFVYIVSNRVRNEQLDLEGGGINE